MSSEAPRAAASPHIPWWRVLRLLLAILPLIWLYRRVDMHQITDGVRRVGLATLASGLAIQLIGLWILSYRWRWMLAAYGAQAERIPGVAYMFRSGLIANYGALIPIPGADEGVRVARTRHVFPGSTMSAVLVLVAERTVGLTGLLIMSFVASLWSQEALSELASKLLMVGAALSALLGAMVLLLPKVIEQRPALRDLLARIPFIGASLARLPAPKSTSKLFYSVVVSAAVHWLGALIAWLLMNAIDPRVTIGVVSQVHAVILLCTAVPLTPAGIGQRELVFTWLYGLAGVSASTAVTVSLLSFALMIAQSAVGGLVLAGESYFKRAAGV